MKVCAYARCPRCLNTVGIRKDGRMHEHTGNTEGANCRGSNHMVDEIGGYMSTLTVQHLDLYKQLRELEAASDE